MVDLEFLIERVSRLPICNEQALKACLCDGQKRRDRHSLDRNCSGGISSKQCRSFGAAASSSLGSSAFVSLGPAGDERFAATGDRHLIHIDLSVLSETEVCEGTGHKNAQPAHPERNVQTTDLHLPSKDDPQQMHYRHDEKQRGGDRHIGFSVQSACLSASQPTTVDSSSGSWVISTR